LSSFIIDGGKKLSGSIRIDGAKNASLPIMAASLLCTQPVKLEDVPYLEDVFTMQEVLNSIGVRCRYEPDTKVVYIDPRQLDGDSPSYQLVRRMRASILVLGPLLARLKLARVALPGGCAIGIRPIDLHLKGLSRLGAEFELDNGCVKGKAARLHGDTIYLDYPSVGATENIMMAASKTPGTTVIENGAQEPEIVDLAGFLNAMGAKISGAGTAVIRVQGVEELGGGTYQVIPDRIEAGTYLIAIAITGGKARVENVVSAHLNSVIAKLRDTGCRIVEEDDTLLLEAPKRPEAINLKTLPYPGFPTDLQAPMVALLSTARGISIVTETVFENRFMHVDELRRMGADIRIEGRSAVVNGIEFLNAADLRATDLRAGAALVLAALAARGRSTIGNIHYLDRGYSRIEEKLSSLGASIKRLTD